jgi:ABC-2 type transport system ATP-binding protein
MLTVNNLSVSYDKLEAVKSFSLSLNKNEIYALVGPDGAGKTTIMRSLCGLLSPDAGAIFINGKDISLESKKIKSIVGYMPQSFSLYPDLSVEENLKFYGGIYGSVGQKFSEKKEYLYSFSNLKPFAGRRAGALSGGMKQKLALSCALIHDPQLLILDEPTTGVDPVSRHQFWTILENLRNQGASILVSTPYMDEVAKCDRASFLFRGQKLAEGTPQELQGIFEGSVYYVDAEPKAQLIDAANAIAGLKAQRFGAGLHLYVRHDEPLGNFTDKLRAAGIQPEQISQTTAALEDVFIQLVEEKR